MELHLVFFRIFSLLSVSFVLFNNNYQVVKMRLLSNKLITIMSKQSQIYKSSDNSTKEIYVLVHSEDSSQDDSSPEVFGRTSVTFPNSVYITRVKIFEFRGSHLVATPKPLNI